MPAPHHSGFYRLDALPATHQQCQSTEGTQKIVYNILQENVQTKIINILQSNNNKGLLE